MMLANGKTQKAVILFQEGSFSILRHLFDFLAPTGETVYPSKLNKTQSLTLATHD